MASFGGPDSPRHTFDNPKPETGLAEWTSKIKALQRQVDEDEEAEQRKLEEEIAAARRARLRRSRGYGGHNVSVELPHSEEKVPHSPRTFESSMSLSDRQIGQEETLRKLTNAPGPVSINAGSATKSHTEPVSLAAFIGGRATGPRLNRPAPQQNAHDPTQFVDPIPKAPHPVFGRGGVAMPGMTSGKPSAIKAVIDDPDAVERYRPSFVAKRTSTSSVAQKYMESLQQKSPPPMADRHISTSDLKPDVFKRDPMISKTEIRERTLSSPNLVTQTRGTKVPVENNKPNSTPKVNSYSRSPISTVPTASPVIAPASPVHPPKSPGPTPSLARPIFPEPRLSPSVPQVPASIIPSPAFQKSVSVKDPTPSISRLQGRGFVQNMVKASSQLQSSVSQPQDKPRPDTVRKGTVLDRWRPNEPLNQPPVASSSSAAQSLSRQRSMPSILFQPPATDVNSLTSAPKTPEVRMMSDSVKATPPLRKVQSVDDSLPRMDSHLGSATTMVVYKPESIKEETEFNTVDELGIKQDGSVTPMAAKQVRFRSGSPEPSVKPLSHPTKERARKPRKSKPSSLPAEGNVVTKFPEKPPAPLMSFAHPVVGSASASADIKATLPSNISQITEKWERSGPIGTKATSPRSLPSPNMQKKTTLPLKQALPGMTTPQLQQQRVNQLGPSRSAEPQERDKLSRHVRIPSTGNRATVMDIASSFNQHEGVSKPRAILRVNNLTGDYSTDEPTTSPDKRHPTYERFSSPVMPVLKEEVSPYASPAGTLERKSGKTADQHGTSPRLGGKDSPHDAFSDERQKKLKTVHFDYVDAPVPKVDIDALISFRNVPAVQSHDAQTIQVDVLSIVGSTANVLSQNTDTFYDTEVLAIVHRSKSKSNGLASATVWGWKGKRSVFGEKEELKLQELARRYSAEPCMVEQYSEPNHLVHVLGGQLTIRQGSRAHWSAENTAMYLVRSSGGVVYIDEHDLTIKNLCSAFSYCISILNSVYVWHGCGSTALERQAALWYAQSLTQNASVIELSEGENDNDEMFWMILGEDNFAKADYWKWRKSSPITDPAIWRVDANLVNDSIIPTSFISNERSPQSSVYIIDCVWELFIMVGTNARGQRQNIKLALDVAMAFSERAASARPYTPTVHVLVLPSRLPLDLRMNVRDMDELSLNNGCIPDHMNLLSSAEALDHLQKRSWEREALHDSTMLPLGLDVSHASTALSIR